MLANMFMRDTSLKLSYHTILSSEEKILQHVHEVSIDYIGVAERLRDTIRVPRPLRILIAEIIYDILRLRNLLEVRERASQILNVGPNKMLLLKYSKRILEHITDLLLASHSVNVFALNASISLKLLEKLSSRYKDDPLIHTLIRDILDSLHEILNECVNYTSIPSRKLVNYYVNIIEREVMEGLG